MSENFETALEFVLEHEGGLSQDPDDPGGTTNLGISFRFLREVDKFATEQDILDMTVDRASQLYRTHFWNACKCDKLLWPVNIVMFDTAVNMGCGAAVRLLQSTLNNTQGANLKIDGGFGPITMNAVKNIRDDYEFAVSYLDARRDFYHSLAESKPKFKKFLKGWLNRVNDLAGIIANV